MADERKDVEVAHRDPAVVFRALFKRKMSPLNAREIQSFFRANGASILPTTKKCRIHSSPDDVFMLLKRGDEWIFVLGTDARFSDPDLTDRSYCTKAWGYFGRPPNFETVRDHTAVYHLTRYVLGAVRDADDHLGTLLITDPPFLPLTLFISNDKEESQLVGVPHKLNLPEALQFAPEIGGCRVASTAFVYTNADMRFNFRDTEECFTFVYPEFHLSWPPVWNTMTTADRYYLIEHVMKVGNKPGFPSTIDNILIWQVELPPSFETLTMDEVAAITAGRSVEAISTIMGDGSLSVFVFDPRIPHRTVVKTEENVADCTSWYREVARGDDEFYEPLEAQEMARFRVAVVKPLDEEEKVPSRDLKPICHNDVEYITREEWDELELNPANPMEVVVTIFYKPGVHQGYCYRLDYLLQDLRQMRSTAYKWVGNFEFGRPIYTAKYHYLLGLSIWLDEHALDQLELSGSRFFALKQVGTEILGHRSGSIKAVKTNVYTLVPITKKMVSEFLPPDEPAGAIGGPVRTKRPRSDESSVSPEAQRTRFSE